MDDAVKKQLALWGKQGGIKTREKHGSSHFSEAGKKGSKVRWEREKLKKLKNEQNSEGTGDKAVDGDGQSE